MTATIESTLLKDAISAHEEAIATLDELVEGLSDEQANWKPGPKKWSIAECIEHLNQGLGTYIERIGPAIEKARADGKTGCEPYGRGTMTGRFIVNFLKKPGKTVGAPGVFQPGSSELRIDAVAGTFRERCTAFIKLAEKADGLKLGHIKFATPVSALIRVSLAQAFELHTLHSPRHLIQAQRVKQHENFPGH